MPELLFAQAETARVQLRVHEACEGYTAAERMGFDPDRCGAARWTCYMLSGDWERAWLESDRIERRGTPDPHRFWHGESWQGKDVLVRCLHGLGDTLQFIRYVTALRSQARSVTVEAQPKLKPLLARSKLATSVITWGEPEPEWQVQMEVNELPRIFRTIPSTIPQTVPYLCPTSPGRTAYASRKLRVGLVWATSSFDPTRNVPLTALQPLFDQPEVEFCSLQAGEGWTASIHSRVSNPNARNASIQQIADQTANLDLVLTVDTMNAHLAGALGITTWTLLPFQCDWRWMMNREDTPWYPTMRLFRQPSPGDWASVIQQVNNRLLQLANGKKQGAENLQDDSGSAGRRVDSCVVNSRPD